MAKKKGGRDGRANGWRLGGLQKGMLSDFGN